jgi:hypothetical protein
MGSQKSREASTERLHGNIAKYAENPKLCKKCNSIIPYDKRRNDFCSHSCSAQYNNLGRTCNRGDPVLQKIKRSAYIKSGRYKKMRLVAQNERNASKRDMLISVFGTRCNLCTFENRITIHRKDGAPHKDFRDFSWEEINDLVTNHTNEYVSVCYRCHKHIHWCMKTLGMSWGEIRQRLNTTPLNM